MERSLSDTSIKKYFTLTYGCQMNVRDSEIICGLLEASGFIEAEKPEDADLIVFNTCSVRHSAENKVFGKLGEINTLKRTKPELLIALGGCMAQIPEIHNRLRKQGVDILFGTHNIHELPALISRAKHGEKKVFEVWSKEGAVVENLPAFHKPGVSAFVNIMFGCNNFCSYCIVPYTRGRERSRQPGDILNELNKLADQGYKEVTLLGQNVNSYGLGLEAGVDFADLLKMAAEIDGIKRIRFMTSHPKDMSDKLIDAIAECQKLCEHIHVPVQAGSNDVLKRMNRHYTREHYLKLTEKIRGKIPEVSISTDLIVGFPGETEKDFLDTIDVVEQVCFDAAFTFMYSARSGTGAANLPDQVPLDEKRRRLSELNRVQYAISADINKALVGTRQEVLIEGPSKNNPATLASRTRTNRIVLISNSNASPGDIVNVRINRAVTFNLYGEIVN
jgi:tRNA-2-methylthio-N6-dimethylallyladenosine synthase